MWCCKCDQHLSKCTCKDINERLQSIAAGGSLAYRSCTICGKHYEQCKCVSPEWTITYTPKGESSGKQKPTQ
jgi:hypothetical protein